MMMPFNCSCRNKNLKHPCPVPACSGQPPSDRSKFSSPFGTDFFSIECVTVRTCVQYNLHVQDRQSKLSHIKVVCFKILFLNGELDLLLPDSGCPMHWAWTVRTVTVQQRCHHTSDSARSTSGPSNSSSPTVSGCRWSGYPVGRDQWGGKHDDDDAF